MKKLQFWEYETGSKTEWKRTGETKCQSCIISKMSRLEEKSKSNHTVNVVQRKKTSGQRQITSAKQLHREPRRGNAVYLALVVPKAVQPQGMTQQQKRGQMKFKGPMRKTPPITETRKKFCSEARKNVQKELYQLLGFADLFPEQLPKGRPPKREVEFEIKTEEGAVPPNEPLIASVPRTMMSCKLRWMTYSLRDISALHRALMDPQFFLCQRRMGAGPCVLITAP